MTDSLQDSMRRPLGQAAVAALAALLLCTACSAADDSGTGGACTQARCDSTCRSGGRPGGTCIGDVCSCLGGGGDADAGTDGDGGGDDVGDGCDERARWIYIVSAENQLIRFYPDELRLEPVGTLDCTPTGTGATPFSMSVDRSATAWVLYGPGLFGGNAGELFRVSTVDAHCESTTFERNQEGLEVFGMGFSSDEAGGDRETLFIGGGPQLSIGTGTSTLATIDMAALRVGSIGPLPGWPELTGTGAAELWGFFPDTDPPSVSKIDKASGNVSDTYDLPIDTTSTEAWAFAFWGGDFWIFLKTLADSSTNIWKLETDDRSVTNVYPDIGQRIVGAGVSTCAPIILR
ncbi:MAG: hypothetical protein HY905_03695 [Deltaproteobacteria bacterium]|nr:hypothetical protein [Deltaproteobacteria bacterium]